MKDSNETISGNRQGKDKVLKDIVSEKQTCRRIYKDMRGFERIHKARHTYNHVCILIYKDMQGYTGLYNNIQGHTRRYKDIQGYIPGYTRIHKARCTCISSVDPKHDPPRYCRTFLSCVRKNRQKKHDNQRQGGHL